jgi:hypothetical protein
MAGSAWWIGRVIQPRDASQRAVRDLITGLCGDSLDSLSTLAELINNFCPSGGEQIPTQLRGVIMRALTGFSNSLLTIDDALNQCNVKIDSTVVPDLKLLRDDLRAKISEPLVTVESYDAGQVRQIHGTILKTRMALIKLELRIVKDF